MCSCGISEWCAGGCTCGCDHDTLNGQRKQAQHFALQYRDMQARAVDVQQRVIAGAVQRVEALFSRWMWVEQPKTQSIIAAIKGGTQ